MQRLPTQQRTVKRIQFFTTNRIILAAFTTNGDIMLWELHNRMVRGKEWGHWNLINTVKDGPADPLECAVSTEEKLFIGVYTDGTIFTQQFSGADKSNFRIFPDIDLSQLKWETLICDTDISDTLQAYKK